MGVVIEKKIDVFPDAFPFEVSGEMTGEELRKFFDDRVPHKVLRFSIGFDTAGSANFTFYAKRSDGTKRQLFFDYGTDFYSINDRVWYLGAGEYLSVESSGLITGGIGELVAKIAQVNG